MEIPFACASHVTGLVQVKEVWDGVHFHDNWCHIRKWAKGKNNQGQPGRHRKQSFSLESMKCTLGEQLHFLGGSKLFSCFEDGDWWRMWREKVEILKKKHLNVGCLTLIAIENCSKHFLFNQGYTTTLSFKANRHCQIEVPTRPTLFPVQPQVLNQIKHSFNQTHHNCQILTRLLFLQITF